MMLISVHSNQSPRYVVRTLLLVTATCAALTGGVSHLSAQAADTVATLRVESRSNQTPWVAASGDTVAVAWGASADGKTDVFLAISRDGGRTFSAPRQVNTTAGEARLGGELPPRVVLRARTDGPPEVVVLWTARSKGTELKLARSLDLGQSFSDPVTIQSAGAPGDRGWPSLALDETGTAHVLWLDHRGLAASSDEHAHHQRGEYDGVAMAQRSGLFYSAVGPSERPERQLTPGVCYCCKTTLAVAPDGALYAAWRHVYPGNIRDIAFAVSRDRGRSFSEPLRVSEDRWQLNGCPDDGPAMTVDATGTIHIVWPTVLQGEQPEGALFYTSSRDGRTFAPRLRVLTMGSARPSHPQISVDASGQVMLAWDEVIDGTRTAFVRSLTNGGGTPTFGETIQLDRQAPSMYPVMAETRDATVVAWTSGKVGASTIQVRRLPR